MNEAKEFDIVVYGATGFTGQIVVEYLAQRAAEMHKAGQPLRWAMAGRDADKLAAARDATGAPADTPLLTADADNPDSLKAMVSKTRLILTTVGPYQLYGSELVRLCAEMGCDYVDLCGEPAWMRDMIDQHTQAACDSGARIVFSCGFDSIPFDLGVYYLQQQAKQRSQAVMSRVKGRIKSLKGRFSGGTAASLKSSLAAAKDPRVRDLLADKFTLTPGFTGAPQPPANEPQYEEALGSWAAPFIMAAINTRNIQRSNLLLDHAYGQDFIYDEMILTGPGDDGEALAQKLTKDRSMMGKDGPKPGEGPSREEREAGSYEVLFIGSNHQDQQLMVSVSGDMDPGYGSTSKMIVESALCLLDEAAELAGGIWTPAPALGAALIDRLQKHAGIRFQTLG
ncbi:MAG: saccharopine dehydrogenase NADP-binding domain-containing protein [Wenzhouxiangellaceae bacterium]